MRIVIANPPGILDDGKYIVPFPSRCDWVGNQRSATTYYPYELGYLSSILKEQGHEVTLLDGHLNATPAADYLEKILSIQADVLVAECGHLSYPTMTWIMQVVGCQSILCGPYGTSNAAQAAEDGWDHVIPGEFEYQVLAMINGWGFEWANGLVDLDTLPFPEDDDLDRSAYWEQSCIIKPMIQMYATRGCTVRCEFCTSPIYYGGYEGKSSHRVRKPENIAAEIEYLSRKYPENKGFFFNDETHNANMPWLREFARFLIAHGLNQYTYEAMCGYWTLKEEDVALLAAAGYKKLRLGVESLTNKEASGTTGKRVNPERLKNVLQWCKDNGIAVHLTSMIGSPGSTAAGDLETLEALFHLKVLGLFQTIQHSITTPNPGTRFAQHAQNAGWIVEGKARHWHSAAVNYPDYPAEQIERVAQMYYILDIGGGV
jgi:anaerobic magnesium-protoporphyrin IX monomethyl ester cyclase